MRFEQAREQMVQQQLIGRGIRDPKVLEAMRRVPRHRFVDEAYQERAYQDHPIPIGEEGQTISQPYMVALMTELLDVHEEHVVLEIGTGSGYQAAVLAELAQQVYTIERLPKLAAAAQQVFAQLQYDNIQVQMGDGTLGWREHAPYDRIIVTAGAPAVPETLTAQLADDGKLVIPVGNRVSQVLQVYTKRAGQMTAETSCHCVFVKLIGEEGWKA